MQIRLTVLCSCLLMPLIVAAVEPEWQPEKPKETPRKGPSMWHRPAKHTPAEQMEFCRSLLEAGRVKSAGSQFLALVHQWPDSEEAPLAQSEYAATLEARGKYGKAFDEYQYLIDNYKGSFPHMDVIERQYRIANHVMTSKGRVLWLFPGPSKADEALPMFEKIVANAPNWSETPLAQFNVGLLHEDMEEYDLAIAEYEKVTQRYPSSQVAAEAAFRTGFCLYTLVLQAPHNQRRVESARNYLQQFLREHPSQKDADTAKTLLDELTKTLAKMYYERGLFYDTKARNPKAAVIAYTDFVRQFPMAENAEIARQRRDALQAQLNAAGGDGRP